ncbi:hypothetical protein [Paraliomyxa miuraensis]|uniref:hypothetical protein n=1 Tax=Paraliomyxa miuraensis TaxID=376150 RepID=UPI00224DD8AA|nr:hypothetical protein [Paraliomyxa miuraensis]MCX4246188.1 hypothetical protein [Paraliomyxa miuraensis]
MPRRLALASTLHSFGSAAALAAALLTTAPASPVLAADDPQAAAPSESPSEAPAESETREVVALELRIAADGRAVGQIDRLVELDTDTALALLADGHEHAVDISVRKLDERGRKLAVTLGYRRDGEAVLESVTVEAAAKKAKIVRSKGSKVALSLKLAPKTVTAEELPAPEPPRPRIEIVEGGNDPLAGI